MSIFQFICLAVLLAFVFIAFIAVEAFEFIPRSCSGACNQGRADCTCINEMQ